jgi:hypothetical protein
MADGQAFSVKRFGIGFLAAFTLLLAVFYAAGPLFARLLLPVMEAEMRFLKPSYRIELAFAGRDRIEYRIDVPFPWTDQSGKRQDGVTKEGRLPASNVSIHPILVLSVLLAWPTVPWRKKGNLILLSLPVILAVELLDLPLHILWRAESGIPLETLSAGIVRFWGHVLSNGGKQFLSLAAVFLSLGAYVLFEKRKGAAVRVTVGRNDPCPCGSGKKFKNCCKE